jgi:hypothetical protein
LLSGCLGGGGRGKDFQTAGNQTGETCTIEEPDGELGGNDRRNVESLRHSAYETGDTVVGEFVDTSEEGLDGLGPGEVWRFRVAFEDETPTQATTCAVQVDGELASGGATGGSDATNATNTTNASGDRPAPLCRRDGGGR